MNTVMINVKVQCSNLKNQSYLASKFITNFRAKGLI